MFQPGPQKSEVNSPNIVKSKRGSLEGVSQDTSPAISPHPTGRGGVKISMQTSQEKIKTITN